MTNQRRRYSQEFKREAVELVNIQGYTVSEAAKSLGVSRTVLSRWRREVATHRDAFPGTGHQTPILEEVRRLREENRRL